MVVVQRHSPRSTVQRHSPRSTHLGDEETFAQSLVLKGLWRRLGAKH
jgi:hypothetical protein